MTGPFVGTTEYCPLKRLTTNFSTTSMMRWMREIRKWQRSSGCTACAAAGFLSFLVSRDRLSISMMRLHG